MGSAGSKGTKNQTPNSAHRDKQSVPNVPAKSNQKVDVQSPTKPLTSPTNGVVSSQKGNNQQNGTKSKPGTTSNINKHPDNTTNSKIQSAPVSDQTPSDFSRTFKSSVDSAVSKMTREKTLGEHLNPRRSIIGNTEQILDGNLNCPYPSTAKIVRIFISSTFTDTNTERNHLIKDGYRQIKAFCQSRGYDFQVMDMRWGIRDEASDDHSGTDLCLSEIKRCQEVSTGPNFVSLISHKYGYRFIPKRILADEFEKVRSNVASSEAKECIDKWYKKDENAVPAQYVLLPISTHYPDFICDDNKKRTEAKNQFWTESDIMQKALEFSARKLLDEKIYEKYTISVTETEVVSGVLSSADPAATCIWLKRTIQNIDSFNPSKELSRYKECLGDNVETSLKLMKTLKEDKLTKALPTENIIHNSISVFDPKDGISPNVTEHSRYLELMNKQFVDKMKEMIENGIQTRSKTIDNDPLVLECLQHLHFCKNKIKTFYGQDQMLQKIKDFMKSENKKPLVIHGTSGSGKTSIMAKVAERIPEWFKTSQPVIVMRFVGTTAASTTIDSLLMSIIQQIGAVYEQPLDCSEHHKIDIDELVDSLKYCLTFARASRPLFLILDSLDQLDPSNRSQTLFWLPEVFGPHVKIVVSTLEDETYDCYTKLKLKIPEEGNFLKVPSLTTDDAKGMISLLLESSNRTLTSNQLGIVKSAFDQCPTPMYLKLSLDEAVTWCSFTPINKTVLQNSVKTSIEFLFEKMCIKHGHIFVSKTLGYLTAAKSGLSETELEDVLSCDDEVLDDVIRFWTPPFRRLPPLLLVRLVSDLQQYLVEKSAEGVRVLNWYHRQFHETARDLFCSETKSIELHNALADFFSGTWSDGREKPYKDPKDKSKTIYADRKVSPQPLKFGDEFNKRKMQNMPYHRIKSKNIQKAKDDCLFNVEFLKMKLLATSVWALKSDFDLAKRVFPDAADIELVESALELSQGGLIIDPFQLIPQLLDRLSGEKTLNKFLDHCRQMDKVRLMPDQDLLVKPGGKLKFCLSRSKGPVTSISLSQSGRLLASTSDDEEDAVKTWDLETGKLLKSFCMTTKSRPATPRHASYACADSIIVVFISKSRIRAMNTNGDIKYTIKPSSRNPHPVLIGRDREYLAVFGTDGIVVYNLQNGEEFRKLDNIQDDPEFTEEHFSSSAGSERYAVVPDASRQLIMVYDLKENKSAGWYQVFGEEDENDDEIDALVISSDETQFLLSNSSDCNILCFSISDMQQLCIIQGNANDDPASYRIIPNSSLLYFPSENVGIVSYDLDTQRRMVVLEHAGFIGDLQCQSANIIVTRTDDPVIRVWDLQRSDKQQINPSPAIGTKIRFFASMKNPRYVVCICEDDDDDEKMLFMILYDVPKKSVIRKAKMSSPVGGVVPMDDIHVLVATETRKLKLVDVDKMSVVVNFEGVISPIVIEPVLISGGKEVLGASRARRKLKVFDKQTGKTIGILRKPENFLDPKAVFISIKVNEIGILGAARLAIPDKDGKGPWIIYNLQQRKLLCSIGENSGVTNLSDHGSKYASDGRISNGGKFACMTSKSVMMPMVKTKNLMIKDSISIFDCENGKLICECFDVEYQKMYFETKNRYGVDVSTEEFHFLDDKRLVSAHNDFLLRIWNTSSGAIIVRLPGHRAIPSIFTRESSPVFYSITNTEEEKTIKLWDKDSTEAISSFTPDFLHITSRLNEDGVSIISSTRSPQSQLIHWRVFGLGDTGNLQKYPDSIKNKELNLQLDLTFESDLNEEDGDPDSDSDEDADDEEEN